MLRGRRRRSIHTLAFVFPGRMNFPQTVMSHLILPRGLLRQRQSSWHTHRQMISTHKVHRAPPHHLPILRALQMLDLVMIRRRQIRAQTAIVARNHHTAASRGMLRVVQIPRREAGLLVALVEDLGILVFADGAEEDDAIVGQHVLCTAGGVLGGAAGEELGVAVLDQFFEDAQVLFVGKNCVVGAEAVLLEQGLVSGRVSVHVQYPEWQGLFARTYPWPWMSRRGFSRHSSWYCEPAMVAVVRDLLIY